MPREFWTMSMSQDKTSIFEFCLYSRGCLPYIWNTILLPFLVYHLILSLFSVTFISNSNLVFHLTHHDVPLWVFHHEHLKCHLKLYSYFTTYFFKALFTQSDICFSGRLPSLNGSSTEGSTMSGMFFIGHQHNSLFQVCILHGNQRFADEMPIEPP